MKKIKQIKQLRKILDPVRKRGKAIHFVPTMGFLHEGHLKLVKEAKKKNAYTVVSIFLNPLQFGPKEDLKKYPKDLKRDSELLEKAGVNLLFCPTVAEIYPNGNHFSMEEKGLSKKWCGQFRPGHFQGVLTVVAKLFHIVQPDVAFFGQKDYQQWLLIQEMVKDFCFNLKVVRVPTVREKDGLAMSSRNLYLSNGDREKALTLYESLKEVKRLVQQGENRSSFLQKIIEKKFQKQSGIELQYAGMINGKTLEPIQKIKKGDVVLLAANIKKTRLIDNWIVGEKL